MDTRGYTSCGGIKNIFLCMVWQFKLFPTLMLVFPFWFSSFPKHNWRELYQLKSFRFKMMGCGEKRGFDGNGGLIFGGRSRFLEISIINFTSWLIFEYYVRADWKILHHLTCYFSHIFFPLISIHETFFKNYLFY